MTNPFDDPDGTFHVLANGEGQHSLWPSFAAVPAGWSVRLEGADRSTATAYVDANWTDLRPRSIAGQGLPTT
ncbi:MbtH family protein [Actinoplanes sp. NPDC051346]|uniref:MbtH family protein n=1 Tax=Actinoplanes sp. NPDC051346 TaxID=3155048 RepID=UPI00343AC6D4